VDLISRPLIAGDRYLFCSDGVTRMVPDSDLALLLARPDQPAEAAADIVAMALGRGGLDNATVVIVYIDEV